MLSAFGIDHGDISKADNSYPPTNFVSSAQPATTSQRKPKYRASHLAWANPRSKTEVKPGFESGVRRYVRPAVGGAVGSLAGRVVGGGVTAMATKNPTAIIRGAKTGRTLGALGGASLGFSENIHSGDTKATNRKTGKQARHKVAIPYGALNIY